MRTSVAPTLGTLLLLAACSERDRTPEIEIWHGSHQRIGHLGHAQPDFNVLGIARGNDFSYRVNGGALQPLAVYQDEWGFRRLGAADHFNADIPIEALELGKNVVEILARNSESEITHQVEVFRAQEGVAELPYAIQWDAVTHPQDVGQIVDGRWSIRDGSLVSEEPLYDRLFLIGNQTWRDYEILTSVTVHGIPEENAPMSGGSGIGLIPRFTGHSVAPPRFPDVHPRWGYQPFGAITWLRWPKGDPEAKPVRQFYRGDRDDFTNFDPLEEFELRRPFGLRASVITSPDDPTTSTYRMRVWPLDQPEPTVWGLVLEQTSEEANRTGGVALVAHHVNAAFGDVSVTVPTQTDELSHGR